MDLTACTADQIMEFADGWIACMAGEPFNPYRPKLWQDGYRFRLSWDGKTDIKAETLH
jgi:hypothetical protein